MIELVIDTSVLDIVFLDEEHMQGNVECKQIIQLFNDRKAYYLCLDNGCPSKIEREYRNKLKRSRDFQIFVAGLWKRNQIKMYSDKIPELHTKNLIDRKFHGIEDLVFVGVAYNSESKKLISEDSDFGNRRETDFRKDAHDYINDEMKIHTYSAVSFMELVNTDS